MPELIAYAKAHPGQINMASGGVGSTPHLAGELFKMMTGVNMLHVPYRGDAPAITDMLAGQDQVMFDMVLLSHGTWRSGALRGLAVTSAKPLALFPDLPPMADFVPGYEAFAWQGVVAPKDTPPDIVAKLNSEINAALADPKIATRLDRSRRHPDADDARRIRPAHRQRDPEMGQGDQVRQHQDGVICIREAAIALGASTALMITSSRHRHRP